MSKIKWALDIIKTTADPVKKLSAYKIIFKAAEKHFNDVEDRFAKPILLEILSVEKTFKEIPVDYKEILAKSHYLLAKMITRSAESDKKAIEHLDKAAKLMPNYHEASNLRESIEMENNYFQGDTGVNKKQ